MEENILYLECYSGISGDMTVAALLDLGADEVTLLDGLKSLPIDGYNVNISYVSKKGIKSKKFDVILEQNNNQHSDEPHNHTHSGSHKHHHHNRNVNEIFSIIDNSQISSNAKSISKKIFQVVAEAESKVHGQPLDKVHFHEVGAVDSIIDIVATAICIDNLNIEQVIISPLYEGSGYTKCQHGLIPVPAPAVVEIISNYQLKLNITKNAGEMITPTGAAIAGALKTLEEIPDNYVIKRSGMGAGTKEFEHANVLRALIIENIEIDKSMDEMIMLSANLDDITGEEMGYAMEKLLEGGGADVFYTPIYMKKNRPAVVLSVICKKERVHDLRNLMFKYTTTFGIREQIIKRTVMDRSFKVFKSTLGNVTIKIGTYDGIKRKTIEYEDARSIAQKFNMPISEVFKMIYAEIEHE